MIALFLYHGRMVPLFVLVVVGFAVGFINTMAGGGSLLSLTSLNFFGFTSLSGQWYQ